MTPQFSNSSILYESLAIKPLEGKRYRRFHGRQREKVKSPYKNQKSGRGYIFQAEDFVVPISTTTFVTSVD